MTGEPEGMTAVLLQLAGLTQKLSALDQRQASDARDLTGRIAAVAVGARLTAFLVRRMVAHTCSVMFFTLSLLTWKQHSKTTQE